MSQLVQDLGQQAHPLVCVHVCVCVCVWTSAWLAGYFTLSVCCGVHFEVCRPDLSDD